MISLLKSVDELDRLDALWKVTAECSALAIRTAGQYAVELEPESAVLLRSNLGSLADALQHAAEPQRIRELHASFRGELREFRDRTLERVTRLRNDVAAAAAVMESLAISVANGGQNHEGRLNVEIEGLQSALVKGDADQLRGSVKVAIDGIAECVTGMRQSNQLMVAQLNDEIRTLHREFEQRERVMQCDPVTGAWIATRIDASITELARLDEPFCLAVFCVRNLKRLESQHPRARVDGALRALVGRLRESVGEHVMVGRRSGAEFVAILRDVEPAAAITISSELTGKLRGVYSVQENGASQNVTLQVTGGVIERPRGLDAEKFRRKLEQLNEALAGG